MSPVMALCVDLSGESYVRSGGLTGHVTEVESTRMTLTGLLAFKFAPANCSRAESKGDDRFGGTKK
jgi:hypothetical protein